MKASIPPSGDHFIGLAFLVLTALFWLAFRGPIAGNLLPPNPWTGPVVYTEPAFPSILDSVTVFFDATQGNGALAGFSGDVYAHTGVITNLSNNGTDWKHVIGNWGTADSRTLMTKVSEDLYSLSYHIKDYYGILPGEEVLQMAFVFRNVDGTIVGRNTDGSDIFVDLFPPEQGLLISLRSPTPEDRVISLGDSIEINVLINDTASLSVFDNGDLIFVDSTMQAIFSVVPQVLGRHTVEIKAVNTDTMAELQFDYFVIDDNRPLLDPPTGVQDGFNYYSDTSYIFQLFAPGKQFAFLLLPDNGFSVDDQYQMNLSTSGAFWLEVPRSRFGEEEQMYQYLVDGQITIADPYAEVVLDPSNDEGIDPSVLSALPPYPADASGMVTVFDADENPYDWMVPDFDKPGKEKLIIYELLMRDFLADHSYISLLDTLNYLEKLGVNAIELMPIQEFEGNDSWGYNPSYHMAVDKYYGTRDQLRAVIDAAHARGIAVILDVVFNHTFSQSPLAQLYWDANNFRPASDNPWLNVTARHPFNVGYDFNHESEATKKWVKQVLTYWILEFKFDGFRFDLSKGLTQTNSGSNAALMAQYDAGRIAILKEYADHIWSLDSTSYVIMEHFAENREEIELAEYGMMLWGNVNHEFANAAKGFQSTLQAADYTHRNWRQPHLIAYMESHDEERLMYQVLTQGDREAGYNTRNTQTALERMAAVSTIYYTIPGPKMLWQFGELGYDFSINRCVNGQVAGCRLDRKPIRWDYLEDEDRYRLFQVTSALLDLRKNYPVFTTSDYTFNDANLFIKSVELHHPEMDALALVNFRVVQSNIIPGFPYSGIWYEYFTGDSLKVDDLNQRIEMFPGEYRLYTSKYIDPPEDLITGQASYSLEIPTLFPNPVNNHQSIHLVMHDMDQYEVVLTDLYGKTIYQYKYPQLQMRLEINQDLLPGIYIVNVHGRQSKLNYYGKIVVH